MKQMQCTYQVSKVCIKFYFVHGKTGENRMENVTNFSEIKQYRMQLFYRENWVIEISPYQKRVFAIMDAHALRKC